MPRIGGDLLEYRSGRLGRLALADQQPHRAALGDGAGGDASAGSYEPCLGLTVVNVLVNDERGQDVGTEQDSGHLIVLGCADVFADDYPTQPHDGQSMHESVVGMGDLPGKVVDNPAYGWGTNDLDVVAELEQLPDRVR